MNCPDETSLLLCAEGSDDRAAAHVHACGRCRAIVDELRGTIGSLREAVPPESNHIAGRVARLVDRRRSSGGRWIALAAAAAVLAATAFALLRGPEEKPVAAPAPAPAKDAPDTNRQDPPKLPEFFRGRATRAALVEKGGGGKIPPPPARADADTEKLIRDLLRRMDDDSAEERDAAETKLRELGATAAPFLEEGAKSESREIRGRCQRLIAALATGTTEDLVRGGLKWLAANQAGGDGSWGSTGVTSLALLAFLGAGETEKSDHGRAVRDAVKYLVAQQDPEGCVGPRDQKYIYGHAIATWALAEAVAAGGSGADAKKAAQKAVEFLVAAQNPGKGWRYSFQCGDNDTSVTFWAATGLAVAKRAGFEVKEETFDGARAWIDEATDPAWGRTGYTHKGTGKVFVPGLNEKFKHHETMSAAAAVFRLLSGGAVDAQTDATLKLLAADPPAGDLSADYYYWHMGTLAAFQLDGPAGPTWTAWNAKLIDVMKAMRAKDGSWDPTDRWCGDTDAGRACATALNALTLTVYYRYPVVRK